MIPQLPLLPPLTLIEPSQPPEAACGDIEFAAMFLEATLQQPPEPAVDPDLPPDAMMAVVAPPLPLMTVKLMLADDAADAVTVQTTLPVPTPPVSPDVRAGFDPLTPALALETASSGRAETPDPSTEPVADPGAAPEAANPVASAVIAVAPPPDPSLQAQENLGPKGEKSPETKGQEITVQENASAKATSPSIAPTTATPPLPAITEVERRIVTPAQVVSAQDHVQIVAPNAPPTPLPEIVIREAIQTQDYLDSSLQIETDQAPIDPQLLETGLTKSDNSPSLPSLPQDPIKPTPAATNTQLNLIKPDAVAPLVVAHARATTAAPLEIVLNPQELGHLRFEIRHSGEQVSVVLTAERPETLDLMRRHADQLMTELRQSGFSDASLSFGQWAQGGDAPPQPIPDDDHAENAPQFAPFTPTPNWSRRSDLGGAGLNLRL